MTAPVDSVKLAARRYFAPPDWTWVRGRWYHEGADTVLGADLQRSQYAPRYYLNLSWWLRSADIDRYPRTYGHIVTRAESHAGDDRPLLEALLDTVTDILDEERANRLGAILERHLTPLMRLGETEAGLRSADGARLLARCLVTAHAGHLLTDPGVSGHLDGQHAATDDAIVTVHVRLLDEGTEVWRPTMAERLPDGTYRLAPTPEYDVTTETWEFPPGTIVVCSQHRLAEGTVLGADALAPSAPPAAYDLPSRQR